MLKQELIEKENPSAAATVPQQFSSVETSADNINQTKEIPPSAETELHRLEDATKMETLPLLTRSPSSFLERRRAEAELAKLEAERLLTLSQAHKNDAETDKVHEDIRKIEIESGIFLEVNRQNLKAARYDLLKRVIVEPLLGVGGTGLVIYGVTLATHGLAVPSVGIIGAGVSLLGLCLGVTTGAIRGTKDKEGEKKG